jgi:hypothetical protein
MKSIKNLMTLQNFNMSNFLEPSNKISCMALRKVTDDYVSFASGKKPYYGYIEENIITFHMLFVLKKHSRKNRVFNIKIDQLIESGIMQHFLEAQFADSAKVAAKQNEEEKQENPEQLTMEHLELCFYAVLIGLALSCVVFVFEILIGLLSR